jgi:LPXTG-site transpeptidase (sortase) family protein
LFFALGVLALAVFASQKLYTIAYQAYTEYSFEQQLKGEGASLRGFLGHIFNKGEETMPSPQIVSNAGDRDRRLREYIYGSGDSPDLKEWSRERRRAFERAQPPPPGAVLGRLEIPSIDLSVMLLMGTDNWTLSRAVGHIEGTALPGQSGNIGVAGHRDGFFRGLRKIAKKDVIRLTTLDGRYEYRVGDIKIVRPEDISVLSPTGNPCLTLVTCYPFFFVGDAPKRFIVTAEMILAEHSVPAVSDGTGVR